MRAELPRGLANALEALLGSRPVAVERRTGGSINQAVSVTVASGDIVFVKWNVNAPTGFFTAEAENLELLRATATIRCPAVIAVLEPGDADFGQAIVVEHLPPREHAPQKRAKPRLGLRAGRALARLHAVRPPMTLGAEPAYGLERDNFVGTLRQDNTPTDDWLEFFRVRRIQAMSTGLPTSMRKRIARLPLERWLVHPPDGPRLLHGDLWVGNVMPDDDGGAFYVDPAVYRGHPEVDLAMARLFGGFPEAFWTGYQEVAGPFDSDLDARLDLYNLYPLLVHARLFGRGYLPQIETLLERFAS